jgi:AcrR family transcriptional regulator
MSRAGSVPEAGGLQATRLKSAQRRAQLLACAMKVFAEHGLEAANHTQVAAEAGVSVPLCFFYFKSRAVLVDAVLGEVEKLYKAAFALADRDELDAAQALKRTSDALIATLDNQRYETSIFIDWSISVRSPTWPRFLRLHRHLVAVLTRVIARGQRQEIFRADLDAEDEAELLHAASFALAQLRMAGASARRIEGFQHSMMRRIELEPPGSSAARRSARLVFSDRVETPRGK